MKLNLVRTQFGADATNGILFINGVFECFTLEDEVRDVKVYGETAIPKGTYNIEFRKEGGTLRHILNDVSLPFGTTIKLDSKIVLETGDKLQGLCSAASSADYNVSFLRQT